MRRLVRYLPSPPMAVALLALFVALGGSAYAIKGVKAPKDSVVSKSIKRGAVTTAKLGKGAVTQPKLADGAVTGTKVAAKSLTAADIDLSSLGIPGVTKYQLRSASKLVDLLAGQGASITVECLPGEILVGGGGRASNIQMSLVESVPAVDPKHQGWYALAANHGASELKGTQIGAYAICAST